jgi:hypothetical protein
MRCIECEQPAVALRTICLVAQCEATWRRVGSGERAVARSPGVAMTSWR